MADEKKEQIFIFCSLHKYSAIARYFYTLMCYLLDFFFPIYVFVYVGICNFNIKNIRMENKYKGLI